MSLCTLQGMAASCWVLGEGLRVLTRVAGARQRDSTRAAIPQEMVCEEAWGGSAMHGTHHAPGTLVPFPC